MRYLFLIIALSFGFSIPAFAQKAPLTKMNSAVKEMTIQEEDVVFKYASMDGEFNLKCTHYFDQPELHDFNVWCGKGTPYFRTFRIHFLARHHNYAATGKAALEVLYWVIDRDQDPSRKFSSTSTWINFREPADIERMVFSQGVENDYAALTIEYKPSY